MFDQSVILEMQTGWVLLKSGSIIDKFVVKKISNNHDRPLDSEVVLQKLDGLLRELDTDSVSMTLREVFDNYSLYRKKK